MSELKEIRIVQAVLRPPLFFGVPRWFLAVEMAVVACAWTGAPFHWSSILLAGLVFLLVHPLAAWKSRDNPWAIEMFVSYLRRPVLYSNRELVSAPACRPYRTVP